MQTGAWLLGGTQGGGGGRAVKGLPLLSPFLSSPFHLDPTSQVCTVVWGVGTSLKGAGLHQGKGSSIRFGVGQEKRESRPRTILPTTTKRSGASDPPCPLAGPRR